MSLTTIAVPGGNQALGSPLGINAIGTLRIRQATVRNLTSGVPWSQNYIDSGGTFVTSGGSGSAPNLGGTCRVHTTSDPQHANVRRLIAFFTVANSADVGKQLWVQFDAFFSAPGVGMDMFVTTPQQTSSYANCSAGTYFNTTPTSTTSGLQYNTGITVPAVSGTASVGFVLQNDLSSLLVYTASTFDWQGAVNNFKFLVVG